MSSSSSPGDPSSGGSSSGNEDDADLPQIQSVEEGSGVRHTGSLVISGGAARPRAASLDNHRTIAVALEPHAGRHDYRSLFLTAYPQIRALGRARADVLGIATFAVDLFEHRALGSMAIAARPGRVLGGILGRHGLCDLRLGNDPFLANRQLAVLVHPLEGDDPDRVRYTVLDLRTHHPMEDEEGRPLEAAIVEGPLIARVGRYALFFVPTGDATSFPERAEDAWEMLPERVILDERPAVAGEPLRHAGGNLARDALAAARADHAGAQRVGRAQCSTITSVGALIGIDEQLLDRDEAPVGRLTLSSAHGQRTYLVGPQALARGLLLGRDPRCDGAGLLSETEISRAHLLIKEIDGEIIAMDTSSTNGTWPLSPGRTSHIRVVALGPRRRLSLAGRADVQWSRLDAPVPDAQGPVRES